MYKRYGRFPGLMLYLSLMIIITVASHALAETCSPWAAKVVSVQGTIEAQRRNEAIWQVVKLDDTYCPGDMMRVQAQSRADIILTNQSVLRLNANTTMTFEAIKEERSSVVGLIKGAAHFFSRTPRSLEVNTPFTVAGVRGTEFFIRVDATQTFVSVFAGQVVAANEAGRLTLDGGQSAVAEAGKAPALRVVARPREAVQWALYYPPVIYPSPATWSGEKRGALQQANEFARQGNLGKAFEALASIPENLHDAGFLTYRASLLLAVGEVASAQTDIMQALRLRPQDSQALALQTIIAIVHQEKDRALATAQQAVAAAPTAATAWIALSYAQQAHFNLEGALASLQKAVQFEPENALAWARLAELQASFGRLAEALEAARRAVALAPELARTQTVVGFAHLSRVDTASAMRAFTLALQRDQADPLPRLGLGLAQIREGDVQAGRENLEIAASLDPNNPLIRSYLGKVYYEEKNPKAQREYDIARELDPQDPTPWFYDAIHKQTSNRPVEALHDLQQAIALNDNRAVYRSRLLLDADLAARSASLARIYSDLGFQQLALVEGWKSVNADPSSFSAHRFLADSYAVLPRHEIARVSELLQSQLLQPLSLTPIQPRLAESNLFLISASGPGALSFNEFNPLFNRDRLALQLNGLLGENATGAAEGVLSGIMGKTSFSLGLSHFETEGFRRNNDQEDNIANVFVQTELSPQTSVQAEFRYRDVTRGDLFLNFFPDDFRPDVRDTVETYTYRFGLRHAFTPASTLLGSFLYQKRDAFAHDEPLPGSSIDNDFPDQTALSGEVQHLLRTKYVNVTSGIGYFTVDAVNHLSVNLNIPPPDGPIIFDTTTNQDVRHINLYLYAYLSLLKNVTFTVGASGDIFDTNSSSAEATSQFNPKFGVVWHPWPDTTIRAAVLRTLKRTLITDQTLEPTQVAGFNQFFDDFNATQAWRYGAAIDQKFSSRIFGGIEFSKRDLSIPFPEEATLVIRHGDAREYLGRTYLFWTPHNWLALGAEYQLERFERDGALANASPFQDVMTHRMPLQWRFFHPVGITTLLKATYINQEGEFARPGTDFSHEQDDFWLFDAALSYRLPKRYGLISIGATNLFDHRFKFQETDVRNTTILPKRFFFSRITLALP